MEQTSETRLHSSARPKFLTASSSASFSKPLFLKPALLEVQAVVGPRAVPGSYLWASLGGAAAAQSVPRELPQETEQPQAPPGFTVTWAGRTLTLATVSQSEKHESCLQLAAPTSCSQLPPPSSTLLRFFTAHFLIWGSNSNTNTKGNRWLSDPTGRSPSLAQGAQQSEEHVVFSTCLLLIVEPTGVQIALQDPTNLRRPFQDGNTVP